MSQIIKYTNEQFNSCELTDLDVLKCTEEQLTRISEKQAKAREELEILREKATLLDETWLRVGRASINNKNGNLTVFLAGNINAICSAIKANQMDNEYQGRVSKQVILFGRPRKSKSGNDSFEMSIVPRALAETWGQSNDSDSKGLAKDEMPD